MDVHLDLNMTMIRPLDGLQQAVYLKEFGDIYKRLEKRLEPLLVNQITRSQSQHSTHSKQGLHQVRMKHQHTVIRPWEILFFLKCTPLYSAYLTHKSYHPIGW